MLYKRRICLAFVLFAGIFGGISVSTAYAEAPAEINVLGITVNLELEGYPGEDCVISPSTSPFPPGANYATTLFGENDSAAEWFDEVSYGQLEFDGDATGPYTVTIPCTTTDHELIRNLAFEQALAAAYDDGYNVWLDSAGALQGDYNRVIFFLDDITGLGSSYGCAAGNYVFIVGGFVNMKRTIIHELGHTLGLGHAQAYSCGEFSFADCGCAVSSYGNPFDIMGGGNGHFSVPGKLDVEWLDDENAVIDVTGSGTFNLTPLATQTGVKALRMAFDDSSDYYFEFRQPVLSDEINGNGLLTYRVPHLQNLWGTYLLDMTPNSTTSDFDDSVLTVGSTYFAANAPTPFSIKPTAMTDSGADAVLSVAVRLSDMTVDLGADVALNSVNPSAVILTPTITGGTGPYTCVWSPDDGCISNANACTVAIAYDEDCVPTGPDSCTGYSGPLPTSYSVTVTDSSNSPIPMQGEDVFWFIMVTKLVLTAIPTAFMTSRTLLRELLWIVTKTGFRMNVKITILVLTVIIMEYQIPVKFLLVQVRTVISI